MIVTFSALVASVVSAVFIARKIAAPKDVRVVRTPMDKVALVKEYSVLSKALVKELDRIASTRQKNPFDLDVVVKSFATIIRRTWDLKTFYGERQVVTFLNILQTSLALERENASSAYIVVLKEAITEFVPLCSEAIIRGETGDNIATFSHSCMARLEAFTSRIERTNRQKINSI